MMDGGLHVEYSTTGGLFLSYQDKTTALTCIQDVLYADDLTMVAETRQELQHMLNVLDFPVLMVIPHREQAWSKTLSMC